jgi:hypothetical protein
MHSKRRLHRNRRLLTEYMTSREGYIDYLQEFIAVDAHVHSQDMTKSTLRCCNSLSGGTECEDIKITRSPKRNFEDIVKSLYA